MNEGLQRFSRTYPKDPEEYISITDESHQVGEDLLLEFEREIGFGSFASGLIRFFKPGRMEALSSWTVIGKQRVPMPVHSRLLPFASTWHGDLFCFDTGLAQNRHFTICMLEPGAGRLLKIARTLEQFIGETLIREPEPALVPQFYQQWKLAGGSRPTLAQCVGYRIPLFLSGADTVENLELINQEVYVSLCGQIFSGIASLPPGTPISKFTITK